MSEAYPLLGPGGVEGFVASTSEFTVVGRAGRGRRLYTWCCGRAYPVREGVYSLPEGYGLTTREWAVYAPLEAYRRTPASRTT